MICRRHRVIAGCVGCLLAWLMPLRSAEDWQKPRCGAELNAMADKLTATLKPCQVPRADGPRRNLRRGRGWSDGQHLGAAKGHRCLLGGGWRQRGALTKGDYVTGTLELKSGVMLQVDKDARLLGSTQLADYPDKVALHPHRDGFALQAHEIAALSRRVASGSASGGEGTIDGRGTQTNFPGPEGSGAMPTRPFLIRMVECKQVVVDGIHLRGPAAWTENYLNCDELIFPGMDIVSQVNWNNDGFDIDGCHSRPSCATAC